MNDLKVVIKTGEHAGKTGTIGRIIGKNYYILLDEGGTAVYDKDNVMTEEKYNKICEFAKFRFGDKVIVTHPDQNVLFSRPMCNIIDMDIIPKFDNLVVYYVKDIHGIYKRAYLENDLTKYPSEETINNIKRILENKDSEYAIDQLTYYALMHETKNNDSLKSLVNKLEISNIHPSELREIEMIKEEPKNE